MTDHQSDRPQPMRSSCVGTTLKIAARDRARFRSRAGAARHRHHAIRDPQHPGADRRHGVDGLGRQLVDRTHHPLSCAVRTGTAQAGAGRTVPSPRKFPVPDQGRADAVKPCAGRLGRHPGRFGRRLRPGRSDHTGPGRGRRHPRRADRTVADRIRLDHPPDLARLCGATDAVRPDATHRSGADEPLRAEARDAGIAGADRARIVRRDLDDPVLAADAAAGRRRRGASTTGRVQAHFIAFCGLLRAGPGRDRAPHRQAGDQAFRRACQHRLRGDFTGHHLGAAIATWAAGETRTEPDGYLPAFFAADGPRIRTATA